MCISRDTCNYIISAAILDFRILVSPACVTDSTIERFDPENIGVAVGILFLASLEAEIHRGGGGSFTLPLQTNVSKITFNIWRLNIVLVKLEKIKIILCPSLIKRTIQNLLRRNRESYETTNSAFSVSESSVITTCNIKLGPSPFVSLTSE